MFGFGNGNFFFYFHDCVVNVIQIYRGLFLSKADISDNV